mmetsp:Transcript_18793/g.38024  ORF Transcript_18793/g.38024 Transcript_18793/m.38024 type:complete len:169 (+) Transcript_18793:164-670(+)
MIRQSNKEMVRFSPTLVIHVIEHSTTPSNLITSQHGLNVKVPPMSKKRHAQQVIARKAVLSFQRRLKTQCWQNSEEQRRLLAEASSKFSLRSKCIALEIARINFLEAHPLQYGQPSKFGSDGHDFYQNPAVPIEIAPFPVINMKRKARDEYEGVMNGLSDIKRCRLTV